MGENQFPKKLTYNIERRVVNGWFSENTAQQPFDNNKVCIKIPYAGKKTVNLRQKLMKIFREKANVIITTTKLKQCLPSAKSQVPKDLNANVVYKLTCSACQGSYVGQTKRYLSTRLKEHQRPPSSVHSHLKQCGGDIATEVLTKERNNFKLLIKEALFIKKLRPRLNNRNELGCMLSLTLF